MFKQETCITLERLEQLDSGWKHDRRKEGYWIIHQYIQYIFVRIFIKTFQTFFTKQFPLTNTVMLKTKTLNSAYFSIRCILVTLVSFIVNLYLSESFPLNLFYLDLFGSNRLSPRFRRLYFINWIFIERFQGCIVLVGYCFGRSYKILRRVL